MCGGQGVCFARNFSYSAQSSNSPPNEQGHRRIFSCLVLTGHYTKGNEDMLESPMRTVNLPYDSVTNDDDDATLFVVFKENQAYPKYMITFV